MDELKQYKERLRVAMNAAKICVFEVDLTQQLYTFFENAEVIFGVSGETILSQVQKFHSLPPEEYRRAASAYFSHPEDEGVIEAAFANILSGRPASYEARMKAGDSQFIWCRIQAIPIVENGKPVRMIGVVTDISDIKEKRDSLQKAAQLDDFTGLYKKGYAIARMEKILQQELGQSHALVILDIDNFKAFNDTYGHDIGDKIIWEAASRLKAAFRKTDILGRFGGDEFILFVRDIDGIRWLQSKLRNLLCLELEGMVCTFSIGVAIYPQDAPDFDLLFKKADRALYRAKTVKEKVFFYQEELLPPSGWQDIFTKKHE